MIDSASFLYDQNDIHSELWHKGVLNRKSNGGSPAPDAGLAGSRTLSPTRRRTPASNLEGTDSTIWHQNGGPDASMSRYQVTSHPVPPSADTAALAEENATLLNTLQEREDRWRKWQTHTTAKLDAAKQKEAQLSAEIEGLRSQLRSAAGSSGDVSLLREQLRAAQADAEASNRRATDALSQADIAAKRNSEILSALEASERRVVALRADLTAEHDRALGRITAEDSLRQARDEAERLAAEVAENRAWYAREGARLQEASSAAAGAAHRAEREAAAAVAARATALERAETLSSELIATRMSLDDVRAQLVASQEKVSSLEFAARELELARASSAAQREDQNKALAALADARSAASGESAANRALRSRNEDLEQSLAEANEKISSLSSTVRSLEEQQRNTSAGQDSSISAMQRQITQAEVEREAAERRAESFNEKVHHLEADLSSARRALDMVQESSRSAATANANYTQTDRERHRQTVQHLRRLFEQHRSAAVLLEEQLTSMANRGIPVHSALNLCRDAVGSITAARDSAASAGGGSVISAVPPLAPAALGASYSGPHVIAGSTPAASAMRYSSTNAPSSGPIIQMGGYSGVSAAAPVGSSALTAGHSYYPAPATAVRQAPSPPAGGGSSAPQQVQYSGKVRAFGSTNTAYAPSGPSVVPQTPQQSQWRTAGGGVATPR